MKLIQNITDSPLQKTSVLLDDGTTFVMELYYIDMQLGWFINRLEYGDFVLKGKRLCTSPNILHQFKNVLPFGIACVTTEDREPSLIEDFLTGASKLYILEKDETDQYQDFISGEV